MCALFFVFGGCCTQRMADEIISETPRLVDYVARSDSGATLFEDYKGERMFTYSYLTNNAGIKITSVFVGIRRIVLLCIGDYTKRMVRSLGQNPLQVKTQWFWNLRLMILILKNVYIGSG